jgi:hypothetical protein
MDRKVISFITNVYSSSSSYSDADTSFAFLIEENLPIFNEAELIQLSREANNNSQCYVRVRAEKDHLLLKNSFSKEQFSLNKLEELTKVFRSIN